MRKFLWIFLLCLFIAPSFGQCPDADDEDFDPFCEDEDAPIDGGVSLLIAASAFYTVKKITEKKKEADRPKLD